MALTDMQVKALRAREKRYTVSDGRGLILEVHPGGYKYWVLRAWEGGKERRRHLGQYPEVGVKEARIKAAEARGAVDEAMPEESSDTFGSVAEEWLKLRMADKAEGYVRTVRSRLRMYILPALGNMEMRGITAGEVLRVCRGVEEAGSPSTAKKCRQIIGQVFRFAVASDKAAADPTTALRGAMTVHKEKHMAALTEPEDVAGLMRNIRVYPQWLTRMALLFSAYTFCRPGEVRHAEWGEINFDAAEWRIPAAKMKMRRQHIVPLAPQVLVLLKALREMTGRGRWLFPSARGDGRSMSENTVRIALRSMGYGREAMTAHGFRGMASTRLNEMGWPPDVIERQLAHAERNGVRAAYNHAEYMKERREMMTAWADYLDGLANETGLS